MKSSFARLVVASLAAALGFVPAARATDVSMDTVVLGGLDKVAARISTFKDKVGDTAKFGTLEIVARTCVSHPPEESQENAAFLEVYDMPPGKARVKVFSGWMFSSSPALSALDHPVYDIWVMKCENSGAKK